MKCLVCGRDTPSPSGLCTVCRAATPSVATGVMTPPPPAGSPPNDITRLPHDVATSVPEAVTGAGLPLNVEMAAAAATRRGRQARLR